MNASEVKVGDLLYYSPGGLTVTVIRRDDNYILPSYIVIEDDEGYEHTITEMDYPDYGLEFRLPA